MSSALHTSLLVELLGTFVFISVILQFAKKDWGAFPIGLALAAVVLFGGSISGGHYNPAVSLAMCVAGKLGTGAFGGYVAAQALGGYLAWAFHAGRFTP
jgi:aquaporin Z